LKKDKAAIQRLARITNQSGFDWKNVKITVTTGSRLPLSIDKVNPFYLRLQPIDVFRKKASRPATPMAYRAKMAPKKRDEEALDMLVEAAPPPAPEAEMEYLESTVSLSETGHQKFELSGKHTVPSGNTPKSLHLDIIELEVEKAYHWSSTQSKLILIHKIKNGEYFLLPGTANVFIEDEFIGQSQLELIHPREKFTLGILESFDIKIEKKLIKREVSKKGLVRGKRQMDFGYKIKIQNQQNRKCDIKIIDRIPHSLDENIEVELNNISLNPKKKNQGVFEWEFALEPEEKINITYDYSVRYPPERKLVPPL